MSALSCKLVRWSVALLWIVSGFFTVYVFLAPICDGTLREYGYYYVARVDYLVPWVVFIVSIAVIFEQAYRRWGQPIRDLPASRQYCIALRWAKALNWAFAGVYSAYVLLAPIFEPYGRPILNYDFWWGSVNFLLPWVVFTLSMALLAEVLYRRWRR